MSLRTVSFIYFPSLLSSHLANISLRKYSRFFLFFYILSRYFCRFFCFVVSEDFFALFFAHCLISFLPPVFFSEFSFYSLFYFLSLFFFILSVKHSHLHSPLPTFFLVSLSLFCKKKKLSYSCSDRRCLNFRF